MPDTLVYLSYGRDCYHLETMFSILSALRFADGAAADWRTLVYTDRPDAYRWLGVDTRSLTAAQLAEWVGQGYPFRRKIMCFLDALAVSRGRLAFLDGDTWWRRDPRRLFARIEPGVACLHLREQRLTRRAGTAGAALQRLFDRGEVRDAAGAPVHLRAGEAMWNSGVIGVDTRDAGRIEEALALIDAIWARDQTVQTLEQFAIGHVFGEAGLRASDDLVFHYWHHRLRLSFLARLPELIAEAQRMPLAEAAAWAYAQRPVEAPWRRAAGIGRDLLHRSGVDHRWTRMSY